MRARQQSLKMRIPMRVSSCIQPHDPRCPRIYSGTGSSRLNGSMASMTGPANLADAAKGVESTVDPKDQKGFWDLLAAAASDPLQCGISCQGTLLITSLPAFAHRLRIDFEK